MTPRRDRRYPKPQSIGTMPGDEDLDEEQLLAREEAMKAEEALMADLRRKQAEMEATRQREAQNAKVARRRVQHQWLKIMRQAKADELLRDVEILSQAHDRTCDRKDAAIERLAREIDTAEEQHRASLRAHTAQLDALNNLQHRLVRHLDDEFRRNLRSLTQEFQNERASIDASHSRRRDDMHELIAAMEREHADATARAQNDFETAREEIKNRNGEDYNALRLTLETSVEALQAAMEDAHSEYVDETGSRAESFKDLAAKDASAAGTIEKRMRRIDRTQEQLAFLKAKAKATETEWKERNETLRKEKENMTRHYRELTRKMRESRDVERGRLHALVEASAEASKSVDAKIAKAEKILKLAEMARKLETEQEKINPFDVTNRPYAAAAPGAFQTDTERALAEAYARLEAAEGMDEIAQKAEAWAKEELARRNAEFEKANPGLLETRRAAEQEKENAKNAYGNESSAAEGTFEHGPGSMSSWGSMPQAPEAPVDEYEYMNRFFDRFNKVFLDTRAVDGERRRLAEENADLREVLKRYLDGVSVNDEVMRESLPGGTGNTLMVVNERTEVLRRQKARLETERAAEKEMAALRMQDTGNLRLEVTGRSDVTASSEIQEEVEVHVRSY